MIGISELLEMRRWLFIAYRFASQENARAVLHERFKKDYTLAAKKIVFVLHWATTHSPQSLDDLARAAARQRRKEPKPLLLAGRHTFKRHITCLTLEGPQTFSAMEPVPLAHYLLFGHGDERECYLVWDDAGAEYLASQDGYTLRMHREGRGIFYGREITYADGFISGSVTYAVLVSFRIDVRSDIREQQLCQSRLVGKTCSDDPFTAGDVQFGSDDLDAPTRSLIKRAQDGYVENCSPFPRNTHAALREYVRQERLFKQDEYVPPASDSAAGLPVRDRIECFKQSIWIRARRQFSRTQLSYQELIRPMSDIAALATVWEPWHLLAVVQEKLDGSADGLERLLRNHLYHPSAPWSLARAQRIMAFGREFVRPHMIEEWD